MTASAASGQPTSTFNSLAGHDLVTVAGDLDGDGHADLVARDPATGRLDAYLGNGQSGFTVKQLGDSWGKYDADRRARRRRRRRSGRPGGPRHRGRVLPAARHRRRRVRRTRTHPRHAGRATTPSPATATSTATARSTCWCGPPGASQVFVKPNRGNGRFGHPLGPVTAPAGSTGLNAGASAYGGPAPGPARRAAATPSCCYRNAGTYETGTPIATGVVVPKAGHDPQRRRLGPRRRRRHDRAQRQLGQAVALPRQRAAASSRRRRRSPPGSRRSSCSPRSAT